MEGGEEAAARAERSGAGAFLVRPLGGGGGGKAQRLFERVAEPTGGQNVAWQPSRCAGAVQPWRRISGCTDRSAGGCADRRTL